MEGDRAPWLFEDTEGAVRLSRGQYQQMAEDTLACCGRGWYRNEASEQVDLPVSEAVQSTRLHSASAPLPEVGTERPAGGQFNLSVVCASTLRAARALVSQGLRVGVLNFASAKNPGGGFLRGANAQEESLARVSGLYPCLTKPEVAAFYADNGADPSCVYTDHMIMSLGVPVFKDDNGRPLDAPYTVGILTAPAPNFGVAATRKCSGGEQAVRAARRRRMQRLLALMTAEGFEAVVLGAWGCGVFKNDPGEIASEFCAVLGGEGVRGALPRVVFAIIDERTCDIFRGVLEGGPRADALSQAAARAGGAPARRWAKITQGGGKEGRRLLARPSGRLAMRTDAGRLDRWRLDCRPAVQLPPLHESSSSGCREAFQPW
eukprot:CAMPEP_0171264080 /NCGR_PEP_ID=MMETSP0790-20130122/57431_1 /TAXON_ID=2925 /ORGANISM="Alexandrium catenella, Strain OF101" /LENGTH=375 /DNA_ID=CAMNT_0011732719 /DNA_START=6 /DNA_END=1130 /DNA_ORIENTATION=-